MFLDTVTTFRAVTKNEQTAVDAFLKSDLVTQRGVAALTARAALDGTPAALLKDRASLQVVLQAFGLDADINQTAVLKALMTQDPASSSSLAVRSGNPAFRAFANFMAPSSTVHINLGQPASLALVTSGASASTLTVQNQSFTAAAPTSNSAPVAGSKVGQLWSFVLNDGSAAGAITHALEHAAGHGARYAMAADGNVTGSFGAPVVTRQIVPAGPTAGAQGASTYTLTLAADATGAVTQRASVISVPVVSGMAVTDVNNQLAALTAAVQNSGFSASISAAGILTVSGNGLDATARPGRGGTVTHPGASTMTPAAAVAGQPVLSFGAAGSDLKPGQIIRSGGLALGTVASVTADGQVTLAAPLQQAIATGTYLTADALVQSFVPSAASTAATLGFSVLSTVQSDLTVGGIALALGVSFLPGQVVTAADGAGGVATIGTIQSIDETGMATLTQPSTIALMAGSVVNVSVPVTAATGPALADPAHLATVERDYETSRFEATKEIGSPGIRDALHFVRSIANVTSVNGLMSDSSLLSVVTNELGLPAAFGGLGFDQQKRLLTSGVKLDKFQDPAWAEKVAERYMTVRAATASALAPSGTLALFGGNTDPGQSILAALTNQTLTTTNTPNQTLSLFT